MSPRLFPVLILACAVLVGCVKKDLVRPDPAADVLSLRYAVAWPERVTLLADRYEAGLERADSVSDQLSGLGEKYGEHQERASGVFEAAADAGTTAPMAKRLREHDVLSGYFDRTRKETTTRLAVAAKAALDKENCACDVSTRGALGFALRRSHEDELDRVRREFNEAHRLVDQHQKELGRPVAESLRADADAVSWTSWFVQIEAVELALDLERRVGEAEDVQRVLAAAIEAEEAWLAADGRRRVEIREGNKRLDLLRSAEIDAQTAAERARALRKDAKMRIRASQGRFDEGMRGLLSSLGS